MKVLNAEQIRAADAYTIKHESVKSIDLMERAAVKCYDWIVDKFDKNQPFDVFCGLGNNGGDGLALARLLLENDYKVNVFVVKFSKKCSADFRVNETRLKKLGVVLKSVIDERSIPAIRPNSIVVDAIFGSGLSKPIDGFTAKLIQKINASGNTTVAIDIPSGLSTEDNSQNNANNILLADYTLTFEVPKLSFLFAENGLKVGEWSILYIGLNKDFINKTKSSVELIEFNDVRHLVKARMMHSHKGNFGHALIVAGSYGKMGAAVLSAEACLRTGTGLLTTYIPKCGYDILQSTVPEAMVKTSETFNNISGTIDFGMYNSVGIGPGIDMKDETANTLKQLIQNLTSPIVIDADALNILGKNKTWLAFLPKASILTPHPKEFERVFGKTTNSYEQLVLQKQNSIKFGIYIVLKGSYTCITCPSGEVYFSKSGNPGMATAGSGDVLTGIITGLLSQGYDSKQAAILGIYLHGIAGDIAADKHSQPAMLARDIVYNIGEAYKMLNHE
jgi:hydroxyethylthiazole kinase-like uncharacterized protein yjeF